ncbi:MULTISPECIES: GH25 family lysozyme [Clostridium]|uniref:GH25 family lysozyme n=1 Tax=Clostridium TaxID=1485 RepID=UPI0008266B44|nr:MULTISPECIES: GH25 family lysozyme [Clostridium]PJI07021.1 glycosyl hydrolase family 25 [Clostridium sp. CT7]
MRGVDIYEGQGNINFSALKEAGIEAVYIKATEGVTYNDSKFMQNYNGVKAAGLKVGTYHYLRANNPYIEAQHFLSIIGNLQFDLRYMIDAEDRCLFNSDASTRIRQFADYMLSHGKDTGVYTYTSFFKEYMDSRVRSLPLWIAEYGVSKPNIGNSYVGFQYSEAGRVSGISGSVDLDEFSDGIFIGNTSNAAIAVSQSNNMWNGFNMDRARSLQHLLNGLGLRDNNGNMLTEDGKPGTRTFQAAEKLPVAQIHGYHNDAYTDWLESQFGQRPDHYFAGIMDSTVRNFQGVHGLSADGKVGINTLKEILRQP